MSTGHEYFSINTFQENLLLEQEIRDLYQVIPQKIIEKSSLYSHNSD